MGVAQVNRKTTHAFFDIVLLWEDIFYLWESRIMNEFLLRELLVGKFVCSL